jgi:hypothetical protein
MRVFAAVLMLLISAPFVAAQATQPSAPDAALELRATQAFNKGDYSIALPMLQKLANSLKSQADQADKLGMIQEQIRVCQKNQPVQVASAVTSIGSTDNTPVVTATPAQTATASPGATATGEVVKRTPHPTPKPGEVLEMDIKDLGNFEYDAEKGSPIPDDVKALNGCTIKLSGFMIPMDQAENISKFALVPSLFNCCMGQPPQIQHTIVVTCPKGKAVNYYPDEIIVQGKLTVDVVKDDGFIVGIFAIETSSVKPAPK